MSERARQVAESKIRGRCLIIAGAGDVGSRLARLRAGAGDRVVTLRRSPGGAQVPGVQALSVDLAEGRGLSGLPERPAAVVFCAAPDVRDEASYRTLFVDGPRRLMDALAGPPARFVLVSSTAVYGEDAGQWVDETTPPRPRAFNGRVLCEAERALAASCPGAVVLRLSGLYGPGRDALLRRALAGDPGGNRWSNRIHVADAAAALSHLLDLPDPEPLYLGADDCPTRDFEVLNWLRRQRGLAETAPPDQPPRGRRVSNARLRRSGWRPRHADYRSGYSPMPSHAD